MSKEISLGRGKVAVVDDDDFEWLSKWKWYAHASRNTWYARTTWFPPDADRRTTVIMHRLIIGASLGQMVDHRDRNGLNNQRSNLRFATRSQNKANAAKLKVGASRFKGVRFYGRNPIKPWTARVGFGKQRLHLPYFKTETEAALAYDAAARKLFGEYARLNFPDES